MTQQENLTPKEQFEKDQAAIEEKDKRTPEEIMHGMLSDEELAPEESTWETERPRIPEKDLKKVAKVVADLVELTKYRIAKDPVKTWLEIQNRAKDKFEKIHIKAHVELVVHGISMGPNMDTMEASSLRIQTNELDYHAYRIEDGEILVPKYFSPKMIVPEIVIDDWDKIELKQQKAEEAIIEAEKRRLMGDTYHTTLGKAAAS
jgi:hypothetical protein